MLCTDLESFICVAECGSFNKASELLFVSANAIKKRIVSLENETGVQLFERTVKGVNLTPSGCAFYNDAKNIVENYKNAVAHAKNIQAHDDVIKIGLSKTFLNEFLVADWFNIREKLPPKSNRLFFYGSTLAETENMIKDTAFTTDIAIDLYDENLAESTGTFAKKNSKIALFCGVSKNSALFSKSKICPGDLSNQTLLCLGKNRGRQIDLLLCKIENEHPGIKIEELEEYSIQALNNCLIENKIILLTENWVKLYPFLNYIPFSEPRFFEFGIYCSKQPSKKVLEFINIVKESRAGTNF